MGMTEREMHPGSQWVLRADTKRNLKRHQSFPRASGKDKRGAFVKIGWRIIRIELQGSIILRYCRFRMTEAKHLTFHDMSQSTRWSLRHGFADQIRRKPQVLVHRHGPLRDYKDGETPGFPDQCISI